MAFNGEVYRGYILPCFVVHSRKRNFNMIYCSSVNLKIIHQIKLPQHSIVYKVPCSIKQIHKTECDTCQ